MILTCTDIMRNTAAPPRDKSQQPAADHDNTQQPSALLCLHWHVSLTTDRCIFPKVECSIRGKKQFISMATYQSKGWEIHHCVMVYYITKCVFVPRTKYIYRWWLCPLVRPSIGLIRHLQTMFRIVWLSEKHSFLSTFRGLEPQFDNMIQRSISYLTPQPWKHHRPHRWIWSSSSHTIKLH